MSRRVGLGLGVFAFVAAALACGNRYRSAAPDEPLADGPVAGDAELSAPAGEDAAELLGINEAITVPMRFIQQGVTGDELAALIRDDAEASAAVGARWVRSHTAVYPNMSWKMWNARGRSMERMDLWVQTAQAAGLSPLVMLSPWPGNQTANHTETYAIPNEKSYAAYVRAVVERYDGDGVDDMPGLLRPIHHWEVDNEPDLKNTNLARGAVRDYDPATFCLPEEYAEVLKTTAALIREADDQAVVLNGGFYRPMTETGYAYMERVFAVEGALESVDVLSLHAYFSETHTERLERGIANGRALAPGKPIWITETSVPSRGKERWISEDYQAEMVVRVLGAALYFGVEKVFWHTLNDPPRAHKRGSGPLMDSHSLYRAVETGGLEEKPAAVAWRQLAALLGGVDRGAIAAVHADGGRALSIGDAWLVWGDGLVSVQAAATSASRLLDGQAAELTAEGGSVTVDPSDGALVLRP